MGLQYYIYSLNCELPSTAEVWLLCFVVEGMQYAFYVTVVVRGEHKSSTQLYFSPFYRLTSKLIKRQDGFRTHVSVQREAEKELLSLNIPPILKNILRVDKWFRECGGELGAYKGHP